MEMSKHGVQENHLHTLSLLLPMYVSQTSEPELSLDFSGIVQQKLIVAKRM